MRLMIKQHIITNERPWKKKMKSDSNQLSKSNYQFMKTQIHKSRICSTISQRYHRKTLQDKKPGLFKKRKMGKKRERELKIKKLHLID